MKTKLNNLIRKYKKEYSVLATGRTRIVFLKNNHEVIKLPLNEEGLEAQYTEAQTYKKNKKRNIFAKCSLVHDNDIPVLTMERVRPIMTIKDPPEWVGFIDCEQVGYNSLGQLVAYDYA